MNRRSFGVRLLGLLGLGGVATSSAAAPSRGEKTVLPTITEEIKARLKPHATLILKERFDGMELARGDKSNPRKVGDMVYEARLKVNDLDVLREVLLRPSRVKALAADTCRFLPTAVLLSAVSYPPAADQRSIDLKWLVDIYTD